MSTESAIHDFKTLILSFHPILAVETVEEDRVERLIAQAADELRLAVFDWTVTQGLVKHPGGSMIHGTDSPLGVMKHIEDLTVDAIFHLKDFGQYLSDPTVARKFREVSQGFGYRLSTIVLSGHDLSLPPALGHKIVHYEMQLPTVDEIREAVAPVVQSLMATRGVAFDLEPAQFEKLLQALNGMTLNQARQIVAYAALIDGALSPGDLDHIVDRKVQIIRDGGILEYYPAEDNDYRVGGFRRLKEWLQRARVGFTPEARALNLHPPKGICIVGVQGCGKSLAAKAIAREWRLPLLKLDAGRLYDKYVGESEKNFRKAIALAESMAPAVLWIDELEKAIGGMAGAEGDGGVSRRIFGAFLTWLQEKTAPVFVVATANDLTQMPPELLRKGRFDEIFFVDLPSETERRDIFEIHLALRRQSAEAFDLAALVDASEGFSGAEIEQVVIASLYQALHDRRRPDSAMMLNEIAETVPLSFARQEAIARLREMARGRFVPVH